MVWASLIPLAPAISRASKRPPAARVGGTGTSTEPATTPAPPAEAVPLVNRRLSGAVFGAPGSKSPTKSAPFGRNSALQVAVTTAPGEALLGLVLRGIPSTVTLPAA